MAQAYLPPNALRVDPVFGVLAQALEARALGWPASKCTAEADGAPRAMVELAFRPSAAPRETVELLPGVIDFPGGSSQEPSADSGTTRSPLARLRVAAGDLEEAARSHAADHPALNCLLQAWNNSRRPLARPRVMGVINVTPDSFSDGGSWERPEAAIAQGLKLAAEGAEVLDVGGESTRPGSAPVPAEIEAARVVPVVAGLARETNAILSVDTTKASVAEAALDAGASVVNDVSAGRFDAGLLALVRERGADIILMHMQNTPRDMQDAPSYRSVVREVLAHLRERASACLKAGIEPHRIHVDPGIGFGKRLKDNLDLIRAIPELRSLGLPIVLGVSRKSFLGRLSGEERAHERLPETVAATAIGAFLGADLHRVHDVAEARAALDVAFALSSSTPR